MNIVLHTSLPSSAAEESHELKKCNRRVKRSYYAFRFVVMDTVSAGSRFLPSSSLSFSRVSPFFVPLGSTSP